MENAEPNPDSRKPLVLIIRDGWGVNPDPATMARTDGNAVLQAKTPVQDELARSCPRTLLVTSGKAVGLPEGQMGNSEVGHLNIGAGRIVYQELTRISLAIEDGSFFENPVLIKVIDEVAASGAFLHLMGLCSDGGVHSHIDHLSALLELAKRRGLTRVLIHCFTDGRDTSPNGGLEYIQQIQNKVAEVGVGEIATITGRYFAMDRDRRWERTSQAYDAITIAKGRVASDPVEAVQQWYDEGVTDEFIPPTVIQRNGAALNEHRLRDGDGVIFFNFRSDRARQLTEAVAFKDFVQFPRESAPVVSYVCMTEYDETFHLPVAFPPHKLTNILAHVLEEHGLRQLRIAETEKYPHVTYFFNGGEETPVAGEDRCMVPSPKVATYDLQPEMSARGITSELVSRLESGLYDVVILNYANADMVGHTGVIAAAIKAVETVDECVGAILKVVEKLGGVALITADHGNAERMLGENGEPFTAHTTFPVELFLVQPGPAKWGLKPGKLADLAPTMLEILGLPQPAEMTGTSLLTPLDK